MHNADVEKSERLQRTLIVIRSHGKYGCTSATLQALTGSMAPATDVSELRRNGYDIDCQYTHMTENHRKVYTYTYRGKKGTA